jgi:hypothetical protein
MDIFTTALTRVVPVPIKPTDLKVKALAKSAASHGVSDDVQGLEDHEYYYKKPAERESGKQKEHKDNSGSDNIEASPVPADNTGQHVDIFDDSEVSDEEITRDKDGKPHLDLFV